MYAVIRTGGKQYRVANGDQIRVEKLDAEVGAKVTFDEVLLVGDDASTQVGTPIVDGASVSAEIVAQERGEKLTVFKYKRRKGYRVKNGHRQSLTRIAITHIAVGKPAKKKAAAKKAAPKAAEAAEAAPEKKAAPKKKAAPSKPPKAEAAPAEVAEAPEAQADQE